MGYSKGENEMSNIQVITNHQLRPLIWGMDLTEQERSEFDYLEQDELMVHEFIRYKGNVYDIGEFDRAPESLAHFFDGVLSDSYFSGVLVKYVDDESVIMARYYC